MDEYIKQFIALIIILLLISTYNIVRLLNNHYPSLLVDFIFHAVFIFSGLFLFFFFYVKNLIRDDTNNTFNGLLNTDGLISDVIKENIDKTLTPEQITEIKIILKESIDDNNKTQNVIQNAYENNQSVSNKGLIICSVIFILAVLITIILKYYYNYQINVTSIVLVNFYIFLVTLCVEYLILNIIMSEKIPPLSSADFIKAVFNRFKYNIENEF